MQASEFANRSTMTSTNALLFLLLIATLVEIFRSKKKLKTAITGMLGFLSGIALTVVVGMMFHWAPGGTGETAVAIGVVVALLFARKHSSDTRKKTEAKGTGSKEQFHESQ